MLEVSALCCQRGERTIFQDLSFAAHPGTWLHVRGENGAGKTSLLRALCGLLAPASGDIRWNHESINNDIEAYHREVCYLGHAIGMKDELSAIENLRIAADLRGKRARLDAESALSAVGLAPRHRAPLATYSQGQKRRVALARLLMSNANLWLLDEPISALDAQAIDSFSRQLSNHIESGGIVVLTSHQTMSLNIPGQTLWLGNQPPGSQVLLS